MTKKRLFGFRKSSSESKNDSYPPLPVFGRLGDTPIGPRPQHDTNTIPRQEQSPQDILKESRLLKKGSTERSKTRNLPPPPPVRAGSDMSEHDFTTLRPTRPQERNPGETGNEESTFARKPLANYNIDNLPRDPGARTSRFSDDGHPSGDDPGVESARRSPIKHSHSSPRKDGNRHSVDASTVDTRVMLERYLLADIKKLKDENQILEEERDSFYKELEQAKGLNRHMSDVTTDTINAKEEMERSFRPISKENNRMKEEIGRLRKTISSRESEIRKLQEKLGGYEENSKKRERIQQEAHREKLKAQELKLRGEKQTIEHRLREVKDQCESLATRLAVEKSNVEALQSEKKRLERKVKQLEENVRKCSTDIRDLETTKKALEDNNAFLEKELGREAIVSQERNLDIRKAQESAFKMMMEPAKWMPKADSEVRRMLDKIGEDIWSWTKACAAKEIDHTSQSDKKLHHSLKGLAQLENGKYYFDVADPRHRAKLPALICKANISSLLYTRIFGNPFFWQAGAPNGAGQESEGQEKELYDIYMDTIQDDEKGGNEWRCQMLRTFDPSIATEDWTDTEPNPSKPEKRRRAAIQRLIEEFLGSETGSILDSNAISDDGRLEELDGILRSAARLSYRLWTQKTRISIWSLSQLGLDSGDGISRFSNGAELVQHHAYHNVELARDDHCLDGKPVAIMTHPAVIVYGDSSGENYSSYKVWKKAEVWMG